MPKPFKSAQLRLEDGKTFIGQAPNWQTQAFAGEVVFNTGMTGYIESLTDPSYTGQILVFTYPLIGNYGVDLRATESAKIHVAGVVVSEAATHWSHEGADRSLLDWLEAQNVPLITDVDTRALTKHLRTRGSMAGAIEPIGARNKLPKIQVPFVSIDEPIIYNPKRRKTVILVDCGMKANILRSLLALPVRIKRVPYNYDYSQEDYAGVLLSNGPGDPADYTETIAVARRALKNSKPIFGICLGNQILALAAGAQTYKLTYGHRGHNQPCLDTTTERGVITSQNHGYAVDEKSLPKGWVVAFRNLNDGSVEGIRHTTQPYFSVQFHPEAGPGPTDTHWLFERFYKSL